MVQVKSLYISVAILRYFFSIFRHVTEIASCSFIKFISPLTMTSLASTISLPSFYIKGGFWLLLLFFCGGNDTMLISEGNKSGKKRYTHKPVSLLMGIRGSLLWWWTHWYLSTNHSLHILIFNKHQIQFFSNFQNFKHPQLIFIH